MTAQTDHKCLGFAKWSTSLESSMTDMTWVEVAMGVEGWAAGVNRGGGGDDASCDDGDASYGDAFHGDDVPD